MEARANFNVAAIAGMPLFATGMCIAEQIAAAMDRSGEALRSGDIVVVAQKIVSKAEGRAVSLAEVTPGADARLLAEQTGRPASLAQLILDESEAMMRASKAAIIVRHRTGHVLANAGIDASNIEGGDADAVLLWPVDPDASARAIRARLFELTGVRPAVVIADSLGRAWRIGTVGTAIGCAGLAALEDRRGETDLFGRTLQATIIAVADSVAGMAVLAMGEGAEGTPAAIVRGAGKWVSNEDGAGAGAGLRALAEDMFR
ncbi:MAG: coenzyme F420-0:L-glutamate ligase [Novosphingobium sp.]